MRRAGSLSQRLVRSRIEVIVTAGGIASLDEVVKSWPVGSKPPEPAYRGIAWWAEYARNCAFKIGMSWKYRRFSGIGGCVDYVLTNTSPRQYEAKANVLREALS
jgi:hypothetical protein